MSFIARYLGECNNCSELITPGAECHYVEDEIEHVHCPAPRVDMSTGQACPRCWLIHKGECL